jgi:DNA modification methylase
MSPTAIDLLQPFAKNPREHTKAHVEDIARSISEFGMVVPPLRDENYEIIAGHGTVLACKLLGMTEIPTICLAHLSSVEKAAFRIAHNKLCESGKWDLELLAANFEFIYNTDLSFDLTITGFATGEIDVARMGGKEKIKAAAAAAALNAETVELPGENAKVISRINDRFTIDRHVIVHGDARDISAYKLAMGDERANLALCDPPYNTKIANNVSGLGKKKHDDFVMDSGEMSPEEFESFISDAARLQRCYSQPGAYNCMFTGWYSMHDMLNAGAAVYTKLSHILIWKKSNGGMGKPWRNAWEGVLVYRVPGGKIHDNVALGKHGRNRTDVLEYAGVNTFRAGRMEELQAHPTCKPTALLRDLILDVTPVQGIVLDVFLGSGATILAAHEAERRGVGIELDGKYVDVAIRRLEKAIGKPAIHHSGMTFAELENARGQQGADM